MAKCWMIGYIDILINNLVTRKKRNFLVLERLVLPHLFYILTLLKNLIRT